jgi:hypothetical protein
MSAHIEPLRTLQGEEAWFNSSKVLGLTVHFREFLSWNRHTRRRAGDTLATFLNEKENTHVGKRPGVASPLEPNTALKPLG